METIACAILQAKHLPCAIREDVLIDIEALSEADEEAFVAQYRDFYT